MKKRHGIVNILLALALVFSYTLSTFAQEGPPIQSPDVTFTGSCDLENEAIVINFSESIDVFGIFDVQVETAIIFGERFTVSEFQSIIPFSAFSSPNYGSPTTVEEGDEVLVFKFTGGEEGDSTLLATSFSCDASANAICVFGDGRINEDCAAPVIVYLGSIDVYGVDPATSEAELDLQISDETIAEVGVPAENTLLGSGTNSATGQPISVYRLTTGEFQLNTFYADGKPYIMVWTDGGGLYYLNR